MFFAFISFIKFMPFNPSASFVEIPSTTGEPFRSVAFAAISTALSVAAFANLLMEFPVIGAITMQSSGLLGPNGSASAMELTTFSPRVLRFSQSILHQFQIV